MLTFRTETEAGTVVCDECGEEESASATDFEDFIQAIKKLGWWCKKTAVGWEHYCFNCRNN